jgi:hypothetical protein
LNAIATPLRLMERYTGLVDRELSTAPDPRGMLAYLASLPAVRFTADFIAFDTDCQTGKVTGTLDAPEVVGPGVAPAPEAAVAEAPGGGLARIPLDQQ